MLGRKNYTKQEIDRGQAIVESGLRAYQRLPDAAKTKEFEGVFFKLAVLLLDYLFAHRLTIIEGKDGNPLNEVRVLCNSIVLNGGELQIEKSRNGRCPPAERSGSRAKTNCKRRGEA